MISLTPTSLSEHKSAIVADPVPTQRTPKMCEFPKCPNERQLPIGQANLCSRCKQVYYCGIKCQKGHWIVHKPDCKTTITVNSVVPSSAQAPTTPSGRNPKKIGEILNRDVISYSSLFSPEQIRELRSQGYEGLNSLKKEFFLEHDYVKILSCLWTEDDLDRKIEWLRGYAEKGYPILMFELSKYLAVKAKKNGFTDDLVKESVKWYFLGIHCTSLDAVCVADVSCVLAIFLLKENYALSKYIDKPTLMKIFGYGEKDADLFGFGEQKKWNPKKIESSPHWLGFFGGVYAKTRSVRVIDPGQWESVRLELHGKLLKVIS